jgi:para-nitrobenzyl esterase
MAFMRDYTESDLVVETSSGPVHGFLDRGVPNWRGVPYGEIEHRFHPPVPVTRTDRISADRWGPVSWQLPMQLGKTWTLIHEDAVESEDCLNLNVWSPGPHQDEPRPVLVWLHTGAHVYGSGSTPWDDVWHFAARHNAVVVTANYRVGMWGWLYLGAHDPAFKDSANLAVLDQILLLRWVQDNIGQFGGDPANVTVFGVSSGGSDAATLLGTPSAGGLFQKAAIYSGNAESPVPLEQAVRFADQVIDAAGPLASTPADLARLPNVGLRHIHRTLLERGGARYGATIDGEVIPRSPIESIGAGLSTDVPVLVSVTADEAGIYDAFGDEMLDFTYTRVVGGELPDDHDEKVDRLSDKIFWAPANRLLTAVHQAGGHGWLQKFDYAPTNSQAVRTYPSLASRPIHGIDVAALFIDPEGTNGTATDRAVGALEQEALMSLARDGQPQWERWSPGEQTTRRIAAP